MKTTQQLAETFINTFFAPNTGAGGNWDTRSDQNRADLTAAMQATLTAFLESVPGVPSVEEIQVQFKLGFVAKDTLAAVRNLMLATFAKETAAMQTKLEAVAKLPGDWKKVDDVWARTCANQLRAALSSATEQTAKAIGAEEYFGMPKGSFAEHLEAEHPAIAPVPEVEKPKEHVQPPAGLVLHNPDNLTPEQVGEGYRLLATMELDGRFANGYQGAEFWTGAKLPWLPTQLARTDRCSYRVPITTPWPEVPAEVKPEKWAAEKKAHAEGKRIEVQSPPFVGTENWQAIDRPMWLDGWNYRVAPGRDTLDPKAPLSHEHLLQLCGGQKPHRWDWTAEMLADKFQTLRPLLQGERAMPGDEWTSPHHRMEWQRQHEAAKLGAVFYAHIWHRTCRPLPAAPAVADAQPDVMSAALMYQGEKQRAEKAQQRVKELEDQVEQLKDSLDETSTAAHSQAFEAGALTAEVNSLEARIAALTPRPITVKPTEEDGGKSGNIVIFFKDGSMGDFAWNDSFDHGTETHWLPGNLAKFCPELVTQPEDKERAAFEAWSLNGHTSTWDLVKDDEGGYVCPEAQVAWTAWQAARSNP